MIALLMLLACRRDDDQGRQPIPVDERPKLEDSADGEPDPGGEGEGEGEDSGPPAETGEGEGEGEDSGPTADTGEGEGEGGSGSGGSGGGAGSGSASVGSVSYAWYVPACAISEAPAPVIFTQHGSGGTGAGMVSQWTTLADRACLIVIGQDSESGMSWNFGSDVTGLGDLIEEVERLWDVDTDRLYLHGYSAGAHWGYVIGLANSDVFAGLAVFAGSLSYAESYGVWPDGTGREIPVFIAHGTDDTTVPYREATRAAAEFEAEGWTHELYTIEGGTHAYDASHQEEAWSFFEASY